jgi:hypothetical protein
MTDHSTARGTRTRIALLAALLALSLAGAALGAARVAYRGRTSQQRPISFTVAGNQVRALKYHIDDRCPGGKPLFVNAWGFPAMAIKHAKFGGTFVGSAPQQATAIVHGRVAHGTVTGTLSDRRVNAKTHKLCSGKATFTLAHDGHPRGSDG